MIINPTPQNPGIFSGMWISNLSLIQPDPNFPAPLFEQGYGRLTATLLPYDGAHLLATGRKQVIISKLTDSISTDTTLSNIISSLISEAQRQGSTTSPVKTLVLSALDPTQPVKVTSKFVDGTSHSITNCFALANTDTIFANVFNNTMVEIARLAGLTVG